MEVKVKTAGAGSRSSGTLNLKSLRKILKGFVTTLNKFTIRVVVKQIRNSQVEFFSVIPAWITKQYRNIKLINNSIGTGLKCENDEEVLKNATTW